MQYLAAYALVSLSGKEPTKESLTAVLKAAGPKVDDKQIDAVLNAVKGKKIDQLIKKGLSKVSLGAGPAPAGKKDEPKKEEAKKEETKKKQEPKKKEPEPAKVEEEEEFGAGDLFG